MTSVKVFLQRSSEFQVVYNVINSASRRGPFVCLMLYQGDSDLSLFVHEPELLSDLADQVLAALRDLEAAWAPTVRAIEAAFVLPAEVWV